MKLFKELKENIKRSKKDKSLKMKQEDISE